MRILKCIIIGVLLLVVPVCALQWGYYLKFRSGIIEREVTSMRAIADLQKERMETLVTLNLNRLDLVTSRRIFRELFKDYLKKRDKDTQYQLNRSLLDIRRAIPAFDVLSVVDLNGEVVTSTNNALMGTNVSTDANFQQGGKRNNIALSFPTEGGNEKVVVLLSGPLVIDDKVVGVAMLKVQSSELLAILRGPEDVVDTYWTLAQRVDAVRVALIRPSRMGTDLVRTIVPEDSQSHLAEAMRGADLTTLDDGPPMHTHATRFVPEVGWVLLLSHDVPFLAGALQDFRNSVLLLSLLLAAYVVGVSLYIGHGGARVEARSLPKH